MHRRPQRRGRDGEIERAASLHRVGKHVSQRAQCLNAAQSTLRVSEQVRIGNVKDANVGTHGLILRAPLSCSSDVDHARNICAT